jgi:hypothetical protein
MGWERRKTMPPQKRGMPCARVLARKQIFADQAPTDVLREIDRRLSARTQLVQNLRLIRRKRFKGNRVYKQEVHRATLLRPYWTLFSSSHSRATRTRLVSDAASDIAGPTRKSAQHASLIAMLFSAKRPPPYRRRRSASNFTSATLARRAASSTGPWRFRRSITLARQPDTCLAGNRPKICGVVHSGHPADK